MIRVSDSNKIKLKTIASIGRLVTLIQRMNFVSVLADRAHTKKSSHIMI